MTIGLDTGIESNMKISSRRAFCPGGKLQVAIGGMKRAAGRSGYSVAPEILGCTVSNATTRLHHSNRCAMRPQDQLDVIPECRAQPNRVSRFTAESR